MIICSVGRASLPSLLVLAFVACGDDASDSAGDVSSASAEDGPELTSNVSQTDGDTSTGTSLSTSSTTDTTSTSSTTTVSTSASATTDDTTDDTTSGSSTSSTTIDLTDTGGTAVDSCADCSSEELCVELTEYAGPADGGGPAVSYTCHGVPPGCDAMISCECAGHLCPGDDGGAEGDCQTDGEILYCSIAYP